MAMRAIMAIALVQAGMANPASATPAEPTILTDADYDRASRFLARNSEDWVLNAEIVPHWLPNEDRFWYRRQTAPRRSEFILVDAAAGGLRRPAFDHQGVAAALEQALGRAVAPDALPFQAFRYSRAGAIEAMIDGALWTCGGSPAQCTKNDAPLPAGGGIASPDGKWRAYIKDHNLWVRPVDEADGFALTTDGTDDFSWGTAPAGFTYLAAQALVPGNIFPPAISWSPDSTRILISRVDDRKTRETGLMQSVSADGSIGPRFHSWRLARPNDADIPTSELWFFDINARKGVKVAVPPIPSGLSSPIASGEMWWNGDGQSVGLVTRSRFFKTMTLYRVEPSTGRAQMLVSEDTKTFIEAAPFGRRPMIAMLANGDVIWFSERDGHGRLYLYGGNGKLKRVIGRGAGQITSIVRLDEKRKIAFVRANGREGAADPYTTSLYRADLQSGDMVRLTPENAEHDVGLRESSAWPAIPDPIVAPHATDAFSPSGQFFVDTYSTVDTPPVTVLRRADGGLVTIVERADASRLSAAFTPPKAFTALAADGRTQLFGVMLRPSNFDPARKYPIIDSIYPGPQMRRTPSTFMQAVFDRAQFSQALAELGFIVVVVDGRGTPGRNKAFLDQSYGNLSNGGLLEDHVSVIRDLGRRHAWMDLDRVGIYGISAGGFAAARAMFNFPEFFKVGVAHAGGHDVRDTVYLWGENYNGPDDGKNYAAAANAGIAKRLKGKLLLMHGDSDPNASPALTLQVADALIKANKDFDMKIIPNLAHAWGDYATRVTWDYMVRNLMDAEPPHEYNLSPPGRVKN